MVEVEHDAGVCTLRLVRPEKANAYTREMLDAIEAGISGRVLLICSTGRTFCGGADLNEMKATDPLAALELRSQAVFDKIARSSAVSIAVVEGPAVAGGCELALACDLRIAGPTARFSLPETRLGLIPSAGGSTRLPGLVGRARAKQMILLGRELDAEEAMAWGLVDAVSEAPMRLARSWAAELLSRDSVALRLAKSVIDDPSLEKERIAESLLYFRKASRERGG